jgi:hypothetical protein
MGIRERETVGVWRNLAAHVLWEHEVAGSNPAAPTNVLQDGSR